MSSKVCGMSWDGVHALVERARAGDERAWTDLHAMAQEYLHALAQKLLGSLEARSLLLLGAGEMAQLAARELKSAGARELMVANRTPQAAEELAREVGGVPVSFAELPALLERADVAICSTASAQPLVTREMMAKAVKARRYRPIFFVDLTLPRNVEPSANPVPVTVTLVPPALTTSGTAEPVGAPAGISTLSWFTPGSPGARPA